MQKTIIGIVVTTLIVYIWGFLYWGVSTLPYASWQQSPDDAVAQEMLAEHFPESGTYFIPGVGNDSETRTALYEKGPTGFVHITHGSSSEADPAIMVQGLLLNLIIVALMAVFFRVAGATEFRDFARLSVIAGAVAVVAIHVGDIVWWRMHLEWKIWQLLYDYSVWLLAGHLLGVFMKQQAQMEQAPDQQTDQ